MNDTSIAFVRGLENETDKGLNKLSEFLVGLYSVVSRWSCYQILPMNTKSYHHTDLKCSIILLNRIVWGLVCVICVRAI